MRALLSWLSHVPKAPSPNVIKLGVKFQHMNFGRGGADVQSIALSKSEILPNKLLLESILYEPVLIEDNEIFIWTFPPIFPKAFSFFHPTLNWMWGQNFLFLMTWRSIFALGNEENIDEHPIQNHQLFLPCCCKVHIFQRRWVLKFSNLIYSPVLWKVTHLFLLDQRGWNIFFVYHHIC